jgi:putative lipoic acid-binding regulatory protein
MITEITEKLDLTYPTDWKYRVIGFDEKLLQIAIDEVLQDLEYSIRFGNRSSGGKFISFEISLSVETEEHRNKIFIDLKKHTHIKMVI